MGSSQTSPRAALAALAILLTGLGACSIGAQFDDGRCGNGVVEPGEDCDAANDPECPREGALACRRTCKNARCPDAVSRCGADGVCRRPTGGFTVSAPVGAIGDRVQVVDYDRDPYLDLAVRGSTTLTIVGNKAGCSTDQACDALSRSFESVAAVATARPELVESGVALLPAPGGYAADPLVAVVDASHLSFYSYEGGTGTGSNALVPMMVPSAPLAAAGAGGFGDPVLVGTATFHPDRTPLAVVMDGKAPGLVATIDPRTGARAPAKLDLAQDCGMRLDGAPSDGGQVSWVVADIAAEPGAAAMLAFVWRGAMGSPPSACVVFAEGDAFGMASDRLVVAQRLTVPALPPEQGMPLVPPGAPLLADVDGDGRLDVLIGVSRGARDAIALYRQTAGRSLPRDPEILDVLGEVRWTPTIDTAQGGGTPLPPSEPTLRGVDVNGDGRADLVTAAGVILNQWPERSRTWKLAAIPLVGMIEQGAVADINRDRMLDWIGIRKEGLQLATCLGDGTGLRWSCADVEVGIPHLVNGVSGAGRLQNAPPVIADLDGDLTLDVLVAEPGGVERVVGMTRMETPGRMALVRGRAFSVPTGAQSLIAFRSRVAGIAALPDASRIASDALVMLQMQKPILGAPEPYEAAVTTVRFGPTGAVTTGFAGDYRLVEGRDIDRDGDDDLVAITIKPAPEIHLYRSDASRHFFGREHARWPLPRSLGDLSGVQVQLVRTGATNPVLLAWKDRSGTITVARCDEDPKEGRVIREAPINLAAAPFAVRAVDLEPDGIDEVVVFADEGAGATARTRVYLVRLEDPAAPRTTEAAVIDGGRDTLALAIGEAATLGADGRLGPPDGRLDLLALSYDDRTPTRVAQGKGDDRFGPLTALPLLAGGRPPVPPLADLLRLGGMDKDPDMGMGVNLKDYKWVATMDFNGDGVRDILAQGPKGAFILFAGVERP